MNIFKPKLTGSFYFQTGYYIVADFSKAVSGTEVAVMYGPQIQPSSKCFSFWFILDTPEAATFRVTRNDTDGVIFLTESEL